ncbi:MAG: RluA family pseudouridine synthase [Planctomycetota bacterium]
MTGPKEEPQPAVVEDDDEILDETTATDVSADGLAPEEDSEADEPRTSPMASPRRGRRIEIETLHADADLCAINKPVGLATVSDRWNANAPTVIGELWRLWQRTDPASPRPHLIHRLDRDTSGVLLFARHRDAQAHVREQFRARTVTKTYLALVVGQPEREGRIELEIAPSEQRPGAMKVVKRGGKACRTDYEVLDRFGDLSLLLVKPHTGRTHQIRISLATIECPCACDPIYGDGEPIFLSHYKRDYHLSKGDVERPLIARTALHAEDLTIAHPSGSGPLTLHAELPKDFRATLRQLERWTRGGRG